MKRYLLTAALGLLALAPGYAHAQAQRLAVCGTAAPGAGQTAAFIDAAGNTCVAILPSAMRGQGAFTASASSIAINAALTLTANSATFPTGALGGTLTLMPQGNASVGVYVCWQGGTCTAAIGEYLAPGQSRTVALPSQNMTTQPPTVISTGTPAVVVEW